MKKEHDDERFQWMEGLIEKHGFVLTHQRKQILWTFIRNSQKHLSAEEVYNILKHKGLGISTVYRNIKLFTDLGILKEFKVEDTSYYEIKLFSKKPLHIHFQCRVCGKIKDITHHSILLECVKMNKRIEQIYKNEISDADIMFYGICKNCKEHKDKD